MIKFGDVSTVESIATDREQYFRRSMIDRVIRNAVAIMHGGDLEEVLRRIAFCFSVVSSSSTCIAIGR
jgi:hypothetical protein